MKRIFILTLAALATSITAFGQDQMDALKYGRNDLTGTAHSLGMGGAIGALGGDISAIAINPAGIGVYKSSEIVTTLNFTNNKYEASLNAGKTSKDKFSFSFDNFGVIGAFPINSDVAPFINFGFTYNKLKNFEKKYYVEGNNQTSITNLMADMANSSNYEYPSDYDFYYPYEIWLPMVGYSSYLLSDNGTSYSPVISSGINNKLNVREKGSIDSYDFSAGTMFADFLSFGLTLSVTDINYRLYSSYDESYSATNGFTLENYFKTEGTGFQVKTGIIIKPINELRFGVSYHSPTWYNMTNYFSTTVDHFIPDFADNKRNDYPQKGEFIDSYNEIGNAARDYKYRTPDKWAFSIAGLIGRVATISADYELTNYSNMTFKPEHNDAPYTEQNEFIKEDFRNSSTLRIGTEIRITPELTGRLGYSWVQSPIKSELKNNDRLPVKAGTAVHYRLDGDTNYFTYGLGYVFPSNFYADVAFVMRDQKDDLYSFATGNKAKLKNNMFSGLLTLGFRF